LIGCFIFQPLSYFRDPNIMPESPSGSLHRPALPPGSRHMRPPAGNRHADLGILAQAVFVGVLLVLLVFCRRTPSFQTLSITFVSIVLEAFPFILIGTLLGGVIEVFVPRERIAAVLPAGKRRSIFLAAALGLIFPVCECAIVPVVRRLLQKGLPLGAAIAFLLGGPIVNPLVALSTVVAYNFDWTVMLERLFLGYLVAVCVGVIFERWFGKDNSLLVGINRSDDQGQSDGNSAETAATPLWIRIRLAVIHAADDFIDIGRFLVIGAFIAALLQTVVPRHVFAALADTPNLSILAMMGMAVTLNLCSEADAFVAAAFRVLLPASAQMAFMVLGPMLDIKLVAMTLGVFRKRAVAVLAGLTFITVFAAIILKGLLIR
jgi:uncharacterized membrane protein YraQ (UPF0718 family)